MSIKEKPGRIGGVRWQSDRPHAIGVYTAAYTPSGRPINHGPDPWIAAGPKVFEAFPTHAEAIAYAFREAGK